MTELDSFMSYLDSLVPSLLISNMSNTVFVYKEKVPFGPKLESRKIELILESHWFHNEMASAV